MLISDYFQDVLDIYPSQKRKNFFKSTYALDFAKKLPVEIFSYMEQSGQQVREAGPNILGLISLQKALAIHRRLWSLSTDLTVRIQELSSL